MKLLKRHKLIVICVLIDLVLFWILFYSGLVLAFINPTLEEYNAHLNSAPRNVGQMGIWIVVHMPTSLFVSILKLPEPFWGLSIFQTGIIAYGFEKLMQRRKKI